MSAPYAMEDDPWSAPSGQHKPSQPSYSSQRRTWAASGSSGAANGTASDSAHQFSSGSTSHRGRASSEDTFDRTTMTQVPPLYEEVYRLCQVGADSASDADISLAQLHRVVQAASQLNASLAEQIISAACPHRGNASASCSRQDLFVALALIAHAQRGDAVDATKARTELASAEVTDIAVPDLDLGRIEGSAIARSAVGARAAASQQMAVNHSGASIGTGGDPWSAGSSAPKAMDGLPSQGSAIRGGWGVSPEFGNGGDHSAFGGAPAKNNAGASGSVRDAGASPRPDLPPRASVFFDPGPMSVHLLPELGGFLFFRHVLYLIKTPLSAAVKRRYSDFAGLHDYLLARFPFRLIPPLPPKRLALPHVNRTQPTGSGQQDAFLEQRRLALARYARAVMSHPALSKDPTVVTFFSSRSANSEQQSQDDETNASTWKGIGNKEDIVEEGLDEGWKLSEADIMHVPIDMDEKLAKTREMAGTILERWNGVVSVFERHVRRTEATAADSTRLSLALSSLLEAEAQTYQGSSDDSVNGINGARLAGVPKGSDGFARSTSLLVSNSQDYADLATQRFHAMQRTLDALKNGRDVWVSVKELFRRHEKLGKDPIADFEARIQVLRRKWKQAREERKPGYEEVCTQLQNDVELDQRLIERYQRRNQRVRVAMWHEVARLQELKNHLAVDWRDYARNEAVNLAATKQAAEELTSALDAL